jgi:3-oxoacyl-[acyl-carrier protein] reductase
MEKRVAIVTGGTRGMGKKISLALANAGNIVLAVYRSNENSALQTKKELRALSPDSDVLRGDVSKKADVDRIVNFAVEKYGKINILVNNAGIFNFAFLDEMQESYLDTIMDVNFKSQVLMTMTCFPHMKDQGFGRVINASSISATIADVGLIGYGCSKAAVNMFTKIAAAELAPYQITVNAYSPGITHTDMTDAMIRERGEQQLKQIPIKRFGDGDEVASLVKFLASDEAGYITGEIIGCDGGFFKVQNPYRAHEHAAEKVSGPKGGTCSQS